MLMGEEYKAWLATLKAGDLVCVSGSYWGGRNSYDFYTIERITATQLISSRKNAVDASYEVRFRKRDGSLLGSTRHSNIEPVTDAIRAKVKRQKLESWASNLNNSQPNASKP